MPTAVLDDPYAVCGAAISDALHILADEFGLDGTIPDATTVAAGLRAMEPAPTVGRLPLIRLPLLPCIPATT